MSQTPSTNSGNLVSFAASNQDNVPSLDWQRALIQGPILTRPEIRRGLGVPASDSERFAQHLLQRLVKRGVPSLDLRVFPQNLQRGVHFDAIITGEPLLQNTNITRSQRHQLLASLLVHARMNAEKMQCTNITKEAADLLASFEPRRTLPSANAAPTPGPSANAGSSRQDLIALGAAVAEKYRSPAHQEAYSLAQSQLNARDYARRLASAYPAPADQNKAAETAKAEAPLANSYTFRISPMFPEYFVEDPDHPELPGWTTQLRSIALILDANAYPRWQLLAAILAQSSDSHPATHTISGVVPPEAPGDAPTHHPVHDDHTLAVFCARACGPFAVTTTIDFLFRASGTLPGGLSSGGVGGAYGLRVSQDPWVLDSSWEPETMEPEAAKHEGVKPEKGKN